jgi:hypothetical protein
LIDCQFTPPAVMAAIGSVTGAASGRASEAGSTIGMSQLTAIRSTRSAEKGSRRRQAGLHIGFTYRVARGPLTNTAPDEVFAVEELAAATAGPTVYQSRPAGWPAVMAQSTIRT